MTVEDEQDERHARQRLRELIRKAPSLTALAQQAGVSKSYLSGLQSGNKSFGVAARRNLEVQLALRPGYFVGADAAGHGQAGLRELPIKDWRSLEQPAGPDGPVLPVARLLSAGAYAVLMQSDSMMSPAITERSIPPGVHIIVDPAQDYARGDDVVAVLEPGTLPCVRRVLEDGPARFLKALNPAYPGLVRLQLPVRVLGRVVGIEATF